MSAEPVPVRLRPPAHRVARAAVGYWALRSALTWTMVAAASVVARVVTGSAWALVALAAAVVVGLVDSLVVPRWRYAVHRWETTPDAVYTQSGWLSIERRLAPTSRIQTVDSSQGPLERLFGLSNVSVSTASASGEADDRGAGRPHC